MRNFVLLTAFLILAVLPCVEAQSRKKERAQEQKERQEELKKLTETMEFVFRVHSTQGFKGKSISSTGHFKLRIEKDSATCYLPFYGRAYRSTYGGEGGIEFKKSVMEQFEIRDLKRGMHEMTFEVKTKMDRYEFTLTYGTSEFASLVVSCTNRETMYYSGVIEGIEKKDD